MDIRSILASPPVDVNPVSENPKTADTDEPEFSSTTENPSVLDEESEENTEENEDAVFVLPKNPRQGWTEEERELLARLRTEQIKWSDVAKSFPGRSSASVRSQWHYRGQMNKEVKEKKEKTKREMMRSEAVRKEIESRSESDWGSCEWSEELKDDFCRIYERLRSQIWNQIAVQMGVPWKVVEANHWLMGQDEIATRAATAAETPSPHLGSSDPDAPPEIVSSGSLSAGKELPEQAEPGHSE